MSVAVRAGSTLIPHGGDDVVRRGICFEIKSFDIFLNSRETQSGPEVVQIILIPRFIAVL